jgi:hypothetical protein
MKLSSPAIHNPFFHVGFIVPDLDAAIKEFQVALGIERACPVGPRNPARRRGLASSSHDLDGHGWPCAATVASAGNIQAASPFRLQPPTDRPQAFDYALPGFALNRLNDGMSRDLLSSSTDSPRRYLSVELEEAPVRGSSTLWPDSAVLIDIGNYARQQRDGRIEELENGVAESPWVDSHLGHRVIKAFNGWPARAARVGAAAVPV